jgi:hypothetical protein
MQLPQCVSQGAAKHLTPVIVNHFTAEIQVHELDFESLLVAGLVGVPIDPPNAFKAARPSRRVVGKYDRIRHRRFIG